MKKRFDGFTQEQHEQAAELLRVIDKARFALVEMCLEHYGVTSPVTRKCPGPNTTTKVRSQLDEEFFRRFGRTIGLADCPYFKNNIATGI